MKKYLNTLLKTFFATSFVTLVISNGIRRRFDVELPYPRIMVATLMIALIIALAIRVFKCEKGYPWLNAILGYLIAMPSLFVFRFAFGTYLFRFSYTLYIIMGIVLIIYGIALWVASKKYRSEAEELNRLLLKEAQKPVEEENE